MDLVHAVARPLRGDWIMACNIRISCTGVLILALIGTDDSSRSRPPTRHGVDCHSLPGASPWDGEWTQQAAWKARRWVGGHISRGGREAGARFARDVAPRRLPAWILAERRKPVLQAALRALGEWAGHVIWMAEAAAWIGAPDPIKLVVCEDLSAGRLLSTLREASVRTRSNVIVMTTDAPSHMRLLLGAGVFDVICMPSAPSEVAASLDRAMGSVFSGTLLEAIGLLGDTPVLRTALRSLVGCLQVGGPCPPHSMAALAREVHCSATYLQDSARQCNLDLAGMLSCVVLLRAIDERRWLAASWLEIGKRVGYSDETGLAKLARRTLGAGLDRLEKGEAKLRARLSTLVRAG